MKYFTSDWHIGDPRIGANGFLNLFMRPFKTQVEQNETIINNLQGISPDDELYVLGDVLYDDKHTHYLNNMPPCKKILIKGNYDEDKMDILINFFDEVYDELYLEINSFKFYLNHYPIKIKQITDIDNNVFGITGHIHGLWKIKPRIVNISTDAWHFKPVSEDEILFIKNASELYYDNNVFLK